MENNLSCDDLKPLISAYFDKELSAEENKIVANHLDICPNCVQELENIRQLSELIQKYHARTEIHETDLALSVINRMYGINTITCNEVLDEISAYFDGELDVKLHYLVEDHLNSCMGCKAEFKKIEKLSSSIKSTFKQQEIPDLWAKIEPHLDNIAVCDEINENLSAYLDKELNKEEAVKVSQHLLRCKSCRRDYESLKYTSMMIKGYFERSVNAVSENNISDKVIQNFHNKERRKELFTSTAAVIIMAVLGWFSVSPIEPVDLRNAYSTKIKNIPDRPIYVKSEDFLFAEAYSMPPKDAIVSLYENN